MRILSILLFIILLITPAISFSQTKEEIQQQMQQALKEMKDQIADLEKQIAVAKKEDPDSVKGLEQQLKMLKQQLAMMEGVGKSVQNMPTEIVAMADERSSLSPKCAFTKGFPVRNTAVINALPRQTLSKPQLITLLTTLNTDLKKKFPAERVKNAQDIITQLENDYTKIARAGVAAWYNNAPVESILLLTYAMSKSPEDIMLNNCGAVLNLLCMQDKALPVLKYVLPRHRKNCTLLNNIGQAFAGLGEKDSAMFYFNQVLEVCPTHPDANATAAYIAYARGNQQLAADYMEKSLTGAYSEDRMAFYKAIRPNARPLVEPGQINPQNIEYFKANGFAPAPNCLTWDQCEQVTKIQDAVNKKVGEINTQYSAVVMNNTLDKILADPVEKEKYEKGIGWTPGPLARKAQFLLEQMNKLEEERSASAFTVFDEMALEVKRANDKIIALDQEFVPKWKACEGVGGNCSERVAYEYCQRRKSLDDEHFRQLAGIAERWETVWYPRDIKWYNDQVFLRPFLIPNERVRKADCAVFTITLANQIKAFTLSTCNCAGKPNCIPPPPPGQDPSFNPLFLDGPCPIDIKIPLGAGSISLNCDAFGFQFGEGVTFRYEKNFKSGETTLAVGLGANLDIPGIDAGAGVELGFKFDSNNQLIDVIGSANAGLGITGMNTPIISAGASVGINSSFTPTFTVMGN